MSRGIIIAAGSGTRWNNYLGVLKPFIKIEGETLLERTVRLFKKYSKGDIYIVGHSKDYKVEGAKLFISKSNPNNYGVDKFINSKELWNKKGRTIVFYGDVWFSEEAMKTICEYDKREWKLFARNKKSIFTGCRWGECFAQSFYPEHIEEHLSNLYKIANEKNSAMGGWAHYKAMAGLPLKSEIKKTDKFYEIDDFTEDFDFPKDYDMWISRYNRLKNKI